MKINIHQFLPEELSDENAYHLVNFFMELALALESHYFVQIRRYINETHELGNTGYLETQNDESFPF